MNDVTLCQGIDLKELEKNKRYNEHFAYKYRKYAISELVRRDRG